MALYNSICRRYASAVFDLILPRYCPCCGNPLGAAETLLCAECLMMLPYTRITDVRDNHVARLFWGQLPVETAYSHIYYNRESLAYPLLMMLKYGHLPEIGRVMGRTMAVHLRAKGFFEGVDGIVPTPLHWWRWWRRGYNQSGMLARGISQVTGIPVLFGLVRRHRFTGTQTHLDAELRRKNVEDAFRSRKTDAKHILLVDDVLTTGATLLSVAAAISKENPDVRFSILTLAVAGSDL